MYFKPIRLYKFYEKKKYFETNAAVLICKESFGFNNAYKVTKCVGLYNTPMTSPRYLTIVGIQVMI